MEEKLNHFSFLTLMKNDCIFKTGKLISLGKFVRAFLNNVITLFKRFIKEREL